MYKAFYTPTKTDNKGRSFPPVAYMDLTAVDVKYLAAVFAPGPEAGSEAHENYEEATRRLIKALPAHLRNPIPLLTVLCSKHKRLNESLIQSLWKALKKDLEAELLNVWAPLRDEGLVSASNGHFLDRLAQQWAAADLTATKCAACSLSGLTHDIDALTATGVVLMAHMGRANWPRSVRLLFIEYVMAGRTHPSHASGTVEKMREVGGELRQTYKKYVGEGNGAPPKIRSAPPLARTQPPTPVRPVNQLKRATLAQDVVANNLSKYFTVESVEDVSTSRQPTSKTAKRPQTPILPVVDMETEEEDEDVFDRAFQPPRDAVPIDSSLELPKPSIRPASSVYSRATGDDWNRYVSWAESQSKLYDPQTDLSARISEIIDLYRHSDFPKPPPIASKGKGKAREMEWSPIPEINVPEQAQDTLPSPTTKGPFETRKYDRHQLPPITIPGPHWPNQMPKAAEIRTPHTSDILKVRAQRQMHEDQERPQTGEILNLKRPEDGAKLLEQLRRRPRGLIYKDRTGLVAEQFIGNHAPAPKPGPYDWI
jgi:hypothetical protein